MACLASLREVARHMVRVRRSLKILQMAPYARGAIQRVVVIDVTIGALARWHRMHSRQDEPGRGVVKLAVAPLHRVMALLARRRKTCVRDRSRGAGEIFLVTRETESSRDGVVVIDVAIRTLARRNGVRSRKRKVHR